MIANRYRHCTVCLADFVYVKRQFRSTQVVVENKERGHYCMCYTYVTVFVRYAANLAHILPKASRTTFT
jgi:hypothetical protein